MTEAQLLIALVGPRGWLEEGQGWFHTANLHALQSLSMTHVSAARLQ